MGDIDEKNIESLASNAKDWVKIEAQFLKRYRDNKCISFDYGLPHDFPPEAVQDLMHLDTRGGNFLFKTFYIGAYTAPVKDFLENCASSVTELHLAHWSYRDEKFFREGMPKLLDLSALRTLHINLVVDDDEVCNVRRFFNFIAEIFKGASSLQQLSCTFPGFWDGEAMEEFLRSLVEGDNCIRSLQCLELSGCFLQTHFLILSALDNLHLSKLTLKFTGFLPKSSPKHIKKFLQSQSLTLKSLKIEDVDSTTKCMIMFPRMEKLRKLKICGSVFGGTGITFQGVVYSEQFPSLENLTFIRVDQGEWHNFVGGPLMPCLTLQILTIKDSDIEDLQNAGHAKAKLVFPNLVDFLST